MTNFKVGDKVRFKESMKSKYFHIRRIPMPEFNVIHEVRKVLPCDAGSQNQFVLLVQFEDLIGAEWFEAAE